MAYVDPSAIHNPTPGAAVPAAWGDAVNDAIAYLANPDQVKVTRSANQTVSAATVTDVLWNAEEWDSNGLHSLVSNTQAIITAKMPGKYLVMVGLIFTSEASSYKRAGLWHGAIKVDDTRAHSVVSGEFTTLKLAAEVELAVNDTLVVKVESASATNLIGAAAGSAARCWASARWIGS